MRIINGIIFILLIVGFVFWKKKRKAEEGSLSKEWLFFQQHGYILLILFVANSISLGMTFLEEKSWIYIEKEGYSGQEKQVDFILEKEKTSEEVSLMVRPKQLKKQEMEKKMQEAFTYLETKMKGQNASLSEVKEDLDFSLDYTQFPFDVEFQPEIYALIDGEGVLNNEKAALKEIGYTDKDLLEGIQTKVTVVLWYGEESRTQEYAVTVFPKEKTGIKRLFAEVTEELERMEREAIYEDSFKIPLQIKEVGLSLKGEAGNSSFRILVFGVLLIILLIFREKENEKQKEKERKESLQRAYPWFVNELVLLLGAGMQVKNILYVVLHEYEEDQKRYIDKQKKNSKTAKKRKKQIKQKDDRKALMEELQVAQHSMEIGMSEEQVYYQLGRRLKLPCYVKLMTLLEQNVKRGAKGLTALFEQEEIAALEERKNLAKRYGEEAGTKLLGPMLLLLLVVMFMIMVPAFLSFSV